MSNQLIDLNDYIAGGYFLTRFEPTWHGEGVERLLPERIISLSPHIHKNSLRDIWLGGFEMLRENALDWGVSKDRLDEFEDWGHKLHKDFGLPDVFYSLESARHFVERFFTSEADLVLIGIALPPQMIDNFLTHNSQGIATAKPGGDWQIKDKLSPEEQFGIYRALRQYEALALGGETLGFEVVGWLYDGFHCSWLCGGIERDMFALHGMRPNAYGLIDSYDDALKVYNWIAEDEQQGTRAEPEPYYPWLVVRYPLTAG